MVHLIFFLHFMAYIKKTLTSLFKIIFIKYFLKFIFNALLNKIKRMLNYYFIFILKPVNYVNNYPKKICNLNYSFFIFKLNNINLVS